MDLSFIQIYANSIFRRIQDIVSAKLERKQFWNLQGRLVNLNMPSF